MDTLKARHIKNMWHTWQELANHLELARKSYQLAQGASRKNPADIVLQAETLACLRHVQGISMAVCEAEIAFRSIMSK